MRFVRETFEPTEHVGGVDFHHTPFGYLAGPLVDAPAGFAPYPDLPGVKVAERTQVRRFLVQSGAVAGVGNRLAVHDRCAPVRFASDDGSGPLNPTPVETMAAAALLIRNRLAVASSAPIPNPPVGALDGATGSDVDAPGIGDASPAASAPGLVDVQSRPGGPPPDLNPQDDPTALRAELDGCRAEIDLLREIVRFLHADGTDEVIRTDDGRWRRWGGDRWEPLDDARPDLADCLRRAGVSL